MTAELLRPLPTSSPAETLTRSQAAPDLLTLPSFSLPWPLTLLTTSDAPEKWTIYENLFYSCLQSGDDRSASLCLDRLKTRFGGDNERVMALMGLYHEAIAKEQEHLETILLQYKEVLEEKPTNIMMRKRRIALLRAMGNTGEVVTSLVQLLDISPTDAEAWAELADVYFLEGAHEKAVYCLEEVLLVMPNAWNMQARLAEVLFVAAMNASGSDRLKGLIRSMKTFCRSIELCDEYLRGFYGLKLTTNRLKEAMESTNDVKAAKEACSAEGYNMPAIGTIEGLNELATKKLAEIIRQSSTSQEGWQGYAEAEVIAARELLDRDSSGPK